MEALALQSREEGFVKERPCAVRWEKPSLAKGGVVVTCPHSGRFYPPELLAVSKLDRFALRRSEDAFVDLLFQDAPAQGAVLLISEFARAFVDVNRAPDELDPKLISELPIGSMSGPSERVKAGLGVIPRSVGDGLSIYDGPISYREAQERVNEVHSPWHTAIETALQQARASNGAAVLLDCHSMPSHAAGDPACDIILGDRFGASCSPSVMNGAILYLRGAGLRVMRNDPYAGGYTTSRHGQPLTHDHVLQIEINRSIYMVEGAMTLRPSFGEMALVMAGLVEVLVRVSQSLGHAKAPLASV